MWWLIPLGVAGLLAALIGAVSKEERRARQRWEEMREDVERNLEDHSRNIARHLTQAQRSYNFHVLVNEHYTSMKAANAAYKLFDDARSSENGINKMLKAEKDRRTYLRERLKEAKKQKKNKVLISNIKLELKAIRELRESISEDRKKLSMQKKSFLKEVRKLNKRTRKLKELIRDECGAKGLEWHNKLEGRKRRRRLS